MSGHSKWSTIKRQKGAMDAKRGKIFTKLSNAISIAVKEGGGIDPSSNPRLRLIIDAAKAQNMPKDNIDRAIMRSQNKNESDLEEVIYEGFGPGGFSFIIEAITDNKQRTTPEVKNKIEKLGGTLGISGSAAYLFEQKGVIVLEKNLDLESIFLSAVDAGALDVEEIGEEVFVYTQREDLAKVRDALINNNLIVKNSEFIRTPLSTVVLNDSGKANAALQFIDKLEEMDDIQKIYANYDIPDEVGKSLL